MLVSLSLFNFVLCLNACSVFSVQFRIMSLCLFRFLCSFSYCIFMLVQFRVVSYVPLHQEDVTRY